MPPSNYSRDDSLSTWWEKLFSIHLYLFRKVCLYLIVVVLTGVRQVARFFGFSYKLEVSDRESWNWEVRSKIPRYTAQLKRKD